jgi:hypothetical protein
MSLKDVFLVGQAWRLTLGPNDAETKNTNAPAFSSVAELARSVANLDIPENPYRGRARACEKHLGALFREDPRSRLSIELYTTLRMALERQIVSKSPSDLSDKMRLSLALGDLERAAKSFERKYERPIPSRPFGEFGSDIFAARSIFLYWVNRKDQLLPILRPIFYRIQQQEVKLNIVGHGVWEALHRLALERNLDWAQALSLLNSWHADKTVHAMATQETSRPPGAFSMVVAELDEIHVKGYMVFFEDNDLMVTTEIPHSATEGARRTSFTPGLAEVFPESEVGKDSYSTTIVRTMIEVPRVIRRNKEKGPAE